MALFQKIGALEFIWNNYFLLSIQSKDNEFIVVGGNAVFATENCSTNGQNIACEMVDPNLFRIYYTPELFLVDADFCQGKQT